MNDETIVWDTREFPLKEHRLKVMGFDLRIVDSAESVAPELIARDIEHDTHGVNELTRDPQTIIDLGANVGIWSIAMAKRFPQSTIFAVEPCGENVNNLRKNLELNNVGNVFVTQCAISHERGSITLWRHPINSGSVSFANPYEGSIALFEPYREMCVRALTLDDLVRPFTRVDFLKVDIEGGEYNAFRSFTLWDKIEHVSVETHLLPLCPGKKLESSENLAVNYELIDKLYSLITRHIPKERVLFHGQQVSYRWGERTEVPEWQKPGGWKNE